MESIDSLKLPECPTPRPGEKVIYYRSDTRFEGTFHGYNTADQLLIRHSAGGITHLDNFMQVRLSTPTERSKGCWCRLPDCGKVEIAGAAEKEILGKLLESRIPPGPRYIDLINEIWARGYEVFLVGGSVRDALNGDNPNDVDLVSTMPFFFLESVVESMFGPSGYSRHYENGFMSVGLDAAKSAKGEVKIDVKNFFLHAPGTQDAEFGADLGIDQRLRDFACNSIYYDPINCAFIDPCGIGIEDAKTKTLNVVNDPEFDHPIFRKAHIALRFFKFVHRGYKPSEECIKRMRDVYKPLLSAVGTSAIRALFFRTLINKVPDEHKAEEFWRLKTLMTEYEFDDVWDKHLKSLEHQFGGGL